MSKTYRNTPEDAWFRKPRTKKERTQNEGLVADEQWEYEYPVSKRNRRNRFIPTDWDDLHFADN